MRRDGHGLTLWCSYGQSTCHDAESELLYQSGIYASVDSWNGAAAVIARLHCLGAFI